MKNGSYIALTLMLIGLVIVVFSVFSGFQLFLLLIGLILFAGGGYVWYVANEPVPASMRDVQEIGESIEFSKLLSLGAIGLGSLLLLIAFNLLGNREPGLGLLMLLIAIGSLAGGGYLIFSNSSDRSGSQSLLERGGYASVERTRDVQPISESRSSSNVANLPAVLDSRPLVNEIIAIEKGKGFNLGGTLRTLTVATLALFTLMIVGSIGLVVEFTLDTDGVAGFIFLLAAMGVAWYVWRLGRQLFPNVEEARRTLEKGIIPIDDIVEGLNAREPGKAEIRLLESAVSKLEKDPGLEFSEWYVIPSSLALTYTFGDVLFISREALDSTDAHSILAHELGHLNNGDGYVRSAIWSLGKGLFGTQNISIFGSVVDDDKDGYQDSELMNLGRGLASKDWTSSLATALNIALTSSGKGVQSKRREIRTYFKKWDIQADGYAMDLVDDSHYLKYLSELEEFERGTGGGPFNAAAIHRFDAVEEAIQTGRFPDYREVAAYNVAPAVVGELDAEAAVYDLSDDLVVAIELSLSELEDEDEKEEIRNEIRQLGQWVSREDINEILKDYDLPLI